MLKKIKMLLILLFGIIILSCKEKTYTEEFMYTESGVTLKIITSSSKQILSGDFCSKEVFSLNNKNNKIGCLLKGSNENYIKVIFSKPVYLKSIDLETTWSSEENRNDLIGIGISQDEDMSEYFMYYKLEKRNYMKTISSDMIKFANLLRIKSVEINIYDKDKSYVNGKEIIINKIKFHFNEKNSYKPKNSLDEIFKNYFKGKKIWYYDDKDLSYEKKYDIIADLIYYALKGNKRAEELLNNINAKKSDESESISNLKNWYNITKEWDGK